MTTLKFQYEVRPTEPLTVESEMTRVGRSMVVARVSGAGTRVRVRLGKFSDWKEVIGETYRAQREFLHVDMVEKNNVK